MRLKHNLSISPVPNVRFQHRHQHTGDPLASCIGMNCQQMQCRLSAARVSAERDRDRANQLAICCGSQKQEHVGEFERHDLDDDGKVESGHGEKSIFLHIFVKVAPISTRVQYATELTNAVF